MMPYSKIRPIAALVLLTAIFLACQREAADTVFTNARIYTLDQENPIAESMVVRGDRIIYAGDETGAMEVAGSRAHVIDLEGQTVIPGLTESHMHFEGLGRNMLLAPLDIYWLPLDELTARLEEAVQEAEEGEWIIARAITTPFGMKRPTGLCWTR